MGVKTRGIPLLFFFIGVIQVLAERPLQFFAHGDFRRARLWVRGEAEGEGWWGGVGGAFLLGGSLSSVVGLSLYVFCYWSFVVGLSLYVF